MTSYNLLLLSAVILPLLMAMVLLAGRNIPRKTVRFIATMGFFFPALAALVLWMNFQPIDPSGYDYLCSFDTGLESLGITLKLGLNGLSMPLFVLAGIVGCAAGSYALQSEARPQRQYLMLLLFMQSGLMGIFASVDVFFFYFFHELALIPTFICIGIWGGRNRQIAAMEIAIYLTLGAMISLVGLLAICFQSGADSFDMITLKSVLAAAPLNGEAQHVIFAFLLFGFGILVSLFPFYSWAPLGYGAAPTSVAMLHAGVLKKFGLYGLLQVALPLLPQGALQWREEMCWLALGSVVVIGFVTLAQRDLKQMIGYSSVMHMGYCFLGIACLSVLGAGGVVILMVAHGLTVALLFLLGHVVYRRTDTFNMEDMGGLVGRAPVLAALFSAAVLASVALPGPGLLNFWGEFAIFLALWDYHAPFVVMAALGLIISAVYGLRAIARIFFGPPSEAFADYQKSNAVKDITTAEKLPALLLLAALILTGLWPRVFTDDLNRALEDNYSLVTRSLEKGSILESVDSTSFVEIARNDPDGKPIENLK